MILLDKQIFDGIYTITTTILRDNFFYDRDSLSQFSRVFTRVMADEYASFVESIDEDFKFKLRYDVLSRKSFTSYFVSYHLHDILVDLLHFSDMELGLFENILPKFVGGYDVKEQRFKRTFD